MTDLIAITIDYETWHPIPPGKVIDWERDVLLPAARLMTTCEQEQAKLTFMAELGEYFWLRENQPSVAILMEQQWKEAINRGHDVQLHLHPNWLPELGARFENGVWSWDWSKAKCNDYPGDLTKLIRKCKDTLESVIRPVNPDYAAVAFRAGAYMVQPFKRLHDALTANGVFCDSSVYAGGRSAERGYDFTFAYTHHQPYFANPYDPQLKAPPAEASLVEIPVFTNSSDERWMTDGDAAASFARRLLSHVDTARSAPCSNASPLKVLIGSAYLAMRRYHRWLNKVLPRALAHRMTDYERESLTARRYFVSIGHTKAAIDHHVLEQNLSAINRTGGFTFITLSDMAHMAREELLSRARSSSAEEARYQVAREYSAIMGNTRNDAQSHHLQDMIPWDRNSLLDLGCGAGYWSNRIAGLYPWMRVTGIDYGRDFIGKACATYCSPRLRFMQEDFSELSFSDSSFDCVYADNTIEHAYDVQEVLSEVHRVLRTNGVLIAAIPSDGRNPSRVCDNHSWKTVPHEISLRLQAAGFKNIRIEEVDTFRELGMPPYPPSNDMMMYIKAWKRPGDVTDLERAIEAMHWVYRSLDPSKSSLGNDPIDILTGGHAWCWGYVVVLGKLLQREGMRVRWLTMLGKGHPRGRGRERIDSHEVLLLDHTEGTAILDPMADTVIPYNIGDVLQNPSLAKDKVNPDSRYIERGYALYDTAFWYSHVHKYRIRKDIQARFLRWRKNPYRGVRMELPVHG